VGDGVPIESRAQCLSAHVQECIDSDAAPFPIGSYVHIGKGHGACMQSVLSMHRLLKMRLATAPEGTVNYTKLCSVLECPVRKWPQLNSTGKAADHWAAGLAQAIRCAMGHCRVMVQQPRKFEQRGGNS
jgi:hypothetical protein